MIRMAKAESRKRGVRSGTNSGPRSGTGSTARNIPRPRRTPFEDDWDVFLDDLEVEMLDCLSSKEKLTPYYTPTSVLKRAAYRFVLKYKNVNPGAISTAIDNFRVNVENAKRKDEFTAIRPIRKSYKNNEFHWVLLGLKSAFTQRLYLGENLYELETYDISRFSLQLQYALDHKVPPDYLIGFLYQCGTFADISRKAKAKVLERWYTTKPR
jgi:hypothetical protein